MPIIRILHVVDSLDQGSGVMSFIVNYYRNIDRGKVQFDFLYYLKTANTYETEINRLGGKTFQLAKPSLASHHFYSEFFQQQGRNYIAVHLHLALLNAFILPLAKHYGIKHLIAHSHNTRYSDKVLNAFRNRILCIPIKITANTYFACSKVAAEKLYGHSIVKTRKVKIISNAIIPENFKFNPEIRSKLRKELGIDDCFVLGHVGRFVNQKNHTFLLKIFQDIKKKKVNSRLVLLGDGPLFETIQKQARMLGVEDSVLFLGSSNNVAEYLQALDAFVLPSLFEGLPVVGIEAQAAGLICFVSDTVTDETAVTNNIYFLSLTSSPGIWAEEILKRGLNYMRTNTTEEIKKAGFDIKLEVKKLENFYLKMKAPIIDNSKRNNGDV